MLRDIATVGPHEPALAWIAAQVLHHRRDRVHHVVVPRPPGKRKATGSCELAIEAETQALCAELDCRWKARVQVDEGDVVDPAPRQLECAPAARFDRRCFGKRPTVADERVLVAVRSGVDEHPTIARYAERRGLLGGA